MLGSTHPPKTQPQALHRPPLATKNHRATRTLGPPCGDHPLAPSTFPTLPAPAPAIYFTFSPLLSTSDLDLIAGEDALDPLMQLQQNLAALNQATIIICLISITKIKTTDVSSFLLFVILASDSESMVSQLKSKQNLLAYFIHYILGEPGH